MKIIYQGVLRRFAENRGSLISERLWGNRGPNGSGWIDAQQGTPMDGTIGRANDPHPRKRQIKDCLRSITTAPPPTGEHSDEPSTARVIEQAGRHHL